MLKFADLSIDNKSKRNSLDSFMQYFPNSYLPLYMMYVGRHNLLDIVENPDDSDKQVVLQITRQEIKDFFEGSEYERPICDILTERDSLLKEVLEDKDYGLIKAAISEMPFYELLKYRDKDGLIRLGIRVKEEDKSLCNIYKILSVPEEQIKKSSKVLLFLLLWEIEWDAF